MATIPENVTLWNYRRIPYTFDPNFDAKNKIATRKAMDKWQEAAGVAFVERVNEKNYLFITSVNDGTGSSSQIGMIGGKQDAIINNDYIGLHELGHALGLMHEHCRSDRDVYVTLQWDNIDSKTNPNFMLDETSNNLTGYDLKSVMHYPAPATGWGGTPTDRDVWTMRWKANYKKKLGGGPNQGWQNLSAIDKSTQGLRSAYDKVPVPMGVETDHGYLNNPYAAQFQFEVEGRHFLYGQCAKNKVWFVRELLPGGKIGDEMDTGSWAFFYKVQFAYSIGNRVFMYGSNLNEKDWFIRELLVGGKIGAITSSSSRVVAYEVQFPFKIYDRVFIYGQEMIGKSWFIQEFLPDGLLGQITSKGNWEFAYQVQFPYTIGSNRFFLYGQNMTDKNWSIHELYAGGTMGPETDNGKLKDACETQFPYNINGNQYFYRQSLISRYWFIQRLTYDGKMGDEIQMGCWKYPYAVQFPFKIEQVQYFYGQKISSGNNWFIQKLIDV